ncbi:unnamed protein product [Effrenium voratum]|nr:unnamed protein product [Effrenium voratum]
MPELPDDIYQSGSEEGEGGVSRQEHRQPDLLQDSNSAEVDEAREQAAAKIQAIQRGRAVRKNPDKDTADRKEPDFLASEDPAEDKAREQAAAKIQAIQRGRAVRKNPDKDTADRKEPDFLASSAATLGEARDEAATITKQVDGSSKAGSSKVSSSKLGSSKVGSSKVGSSKVGSSKVGSSKVNNSKADKADSSKADSSKADGKAGSNKVSSRAGSKAPSRAGSQAAKKGPPTSKQSAVSNPQPANAAKEKPRSKSPRTPRTLQADKREGSPGQHSLTPGPASAPTGWDSSTYIEATPDKPSLSALERRPGSPPAEGQGARRMLKPDEPPPWERLYQQALQAKEAEPEAPTPVPTPVTPKAARGLEDQEIFWLRNEVHLLRREVTRLQQEPPKEPPASGSKPMHFGMHDLPKRPEKEKEKEIKDPEPLSPTNAEIVTSLRAERDRLLAEAAKLRSVAKTERPKAAARMPSKPEAAPEAPEAPERAKTARALQQAGWNQKLKTKQEGRSSPSPSPRSVRQASPKRSQSQRNLSKASPGQGPKSQGGQSQQNLSKSPSQRSKSQQNLSKANSLGKASSHGKASSLGKASLGKASSQGKASSPRQRSQSPKSQSQQLGKSTPRQTQRQHASPSKTQAQRGPSRSQSQRNLRASPRGSPSRSRSPSSRSGSRSSPSRQAPRSRGSSRSQSPRQKPKAPSSRIFERLHRDHAYRQWELEERRAEAAARELQLAKALQGRTVTVASTAEARAAGTRLHEEARHMQTRLAAKRAELEDLQAREPRFGEPAESAEGSTARGAQLYAAALRRQQRQEERRRLQSLEEEQWIKDHDLHKFSSRDGCEPYTRLYEDAKQRNHRLFMKGQLKLAEEAQGAVSVHEPLGADFAQRVAEQRARCLYQDAQQRQERLEARRELAAAWAPVPARKARKREASPQAETHPPVPHSAFERARAAELSPSLDGANDLSSCCPESAIGLAHIKPQSQIAFLSHIILWSMWQQRTAVAGACV